MGRKSRGGRRRRRRSEAAQLAAQYNERGLEREVDDALLYQKCKKEHSKHAKEVARREQELLSRTIFVTNVNDLRRRGNVLLLVAFFENNYGPVEKCILASYYGKGGGRGGGFPKARVRFMHERDAKAIFGGRKLSSVKSPVEIHNGTIGHRGFLRVFPSLPYPEMDEASSDDKFIVTADHSYIGHWHPLTHDEMFTDRDDVGLLDGNLFLVEDIIPDGVELSFDLNLRTVEMRLLPSKDFVISFRFKDLLGSMDCFREDASGSSFAIVFRLKYPPKLYRLEIQRDRDGVDQEIATRSVSMKGIQSDTIGSCYAYMIRLSRRSLRMLFSNDEKLGKMKKFGLLSRNLFTPNDAQTISTHMVCGDKERVENLLQCSPNRQIGLLLRSLTDNGRFCRYTALHDTMEVFGGMKNIFELIEAVSPIRAVNALERMAAVTLPTRFPAKCLHAMLMLDGDDDDSGDDESNSEDLKSYAIPEYCIRTPRLLITPTRLALVGFSIEMSNRVVRHFIANSGFEPECFLRVTIGEESGARMYSSELSIDVCRRIENLVLNGITLNGRRYRFLAYSSSQLKECSLWMVDAQDPWTIDSIRSWMGDFSMCESPSKVAARMGQCFSTTVVASDANSSSLRHSVKDDFPDVVCRNNGKEMCHSDGTGLIKRSVLESLITRLPLGPKDPTEVSVIQIRFGGAKGTLVAWDFSQLGLSGNAGRSDVLLRPSMVKFKAPYQQLEVISFGNQIPYYLNRNVILLLKVHGIQDEIFLKMQRRMLDELDAMLVDSRKAIEMIPRLSGPDSSLSSALVHMLSCGLSPRDEPFLFSCLHAIRSHHLMNLRKKSRVFVEKGTVLIGGLDETGIVPEGCVFVQMRPNGVSSGFQILDGPIMVTKHPVLHQGDVRMLLAVNIPELKHHKNVILFSRHGQRPEADKMSGSDLDGDQFAVTWDERLFLGDWNGSIRQSSGRWQSASGETLLMRSDTMAEDSQTLQNTNAHPMDFDPDSASKDELPVDPRLFASFAKAFGFHLGAQANATRLGTVDDKELLDHFINHAKNDNLGHIATMWLDYANERGANCEECLQLAALHSVAVDFPKSGKPAVVPKELFISRTVARAHWREKKDSPSYDCAGPLGRMYDEVVRKMQNDENSNEFELPLAGRRFDRYGQILRFVQNSSSVDKNLSKIYKPEIAAQLDLDLEAAFGPCSHHTLDFIGEALDHRDAYENGLIGLMSKYGLQCEGELLTGCIRKFHKLDKKRQHDLSEAVRTQCRELRKSARRTFFSFILYTVCPTLAEMEVDEDEERSWVDVVAAAAKGEAVLLPEESFFSAIDVGTFTTVARQLAAAYYVVTYNPDMWWDDSRTKRRSMLFSFPWTVADVISKGLVDGSV